MAENRSPTAIALRPAVFKSPPGGFNLIYLHGLTNKNGGGNHYRDRRQTTLISITAPRSREIRKSVVLLAKRKQSWIGNEIN